MCETRRPIGKLRPLVADMPINLWGQDLLQQWGTQINIPSIPEPIPKIKSGVEDASVDSIEKV